MLTIKADGQTIDLPEDFSITLNGKSPIFNDIGDFSYPCKVKYSLRNATIFKFLNRVECTSNPYHEFDGEVMWDGITIAAGRLKVKIGNSLGFEFQIYPNEGDFYYAIKDKLLRQIDYGSRFNAAMPDAIVTFANSIIGQSYPQSPVTFPMIFDDTYLDPVPEDEELWYINRYEKRVHEPTYRLHHLTAAGNWNIIVPMLFYRYVLDCIFKNLGYVYKDEFFSANPAFNSMVLFNSKNSHAEAIDEEVYIRYNLHVPDITLKDFFLGQETFFNVRNFVNRATKTVTLKSVTQILSSVGSIDISKKVLSVSVEMEDQVPGYLVKMELDGGDTGQAEFSQVQEDFMKLFKGCVDTFNNLPAFPDAVIGQVFLVQDENIFYQFNIDLIWHPYYRRYLNLNLFSQMINGNISNATELTSAFSTLLNYSQLYGFSFGDTVGCGNKGEEWADIKPRVFFSIYKPATPSTFGGSMQSYSDIPGNISLPYCCPKNPYLLYYKDYLDWLIKTKAVKINAQCSFLDLRDIDYSKKYSIDGVNYLIKDYQVTLKKEQISSTTFTAYVCP